MRKYKSISNALWCVINGRAAAPPARYARQAFLLRHSHCHLDNDGFANNLTAFHETIKAFFVTD